MPRLSDRNYLQIHTLLATAWLSDQQAFGRISSQDQHYLHDYFRPSEPLTEAELLAHRRAVSRSRPSLPQCAGRALQRFARPAPLRPLPLQATGRHRIRVTAIVRPQPDLARLSAALRGLVRHIREADPEAFDRDPSETIRRFMSRPPV